MKTRKFYIWFDRDGSFETEEGLGWLTGEREPEEMAYTGDCLEVEINPADIQHHAEAQKGEDIHDYLNENEIPYTHMPMHSNVYTGTVIYDMETQEWGLLEDLDTAPTVTHWDGSNTRYHNLVEDRWQEVVEVETDAVCIDRWDGSNMTTGGTGNHAHVYKTTDGRYVLVLSSQWEGSKDTAAIMTATELRGYLVSIDRADEADEILSKEKVVGVQVRLPESLRKDLKKKLLDEGKSIQEFFRQAVEEYLR
ncbi:MAG: ribbon-helix-helix protein, CopG family [Firmicutes bacterium]|nr:ribbon-helix-helix protein, CopG family [Bacillota bacterium]